MRSILRNFRWAIWVTTFALFVYTFLVAAEILVVLTNIIFIASPFIVIWMVWTVLRDDFTTHKTFDNYFYQDSEIKRVTIRQDTDNTTP